MACKPEKISNTHTSPVGKRDAKRDLRRRWRRMVKADILNAPERKPYRGWAW